jgi:hypothetical protein
LARREIRKFEFAAAELVPGPFADTFDTSLSVPSARGFQRNRLAIGQQQ